LGNPKLRGGSSDPAITNKIASASRHANAVLNHVGNSMVDVLAKNAVPAIKAVVKGHQALKDSRNVMPALELRRLWERDTYGFG